MNNLCTGAELTDRVRDSIIEARTDCQNDVAVMHRHIRLVKPVHTQHAEELAVGRWIGAQTH